MPILILQGSDDSITPQQITDMLFDRLCEIGSRTDYRVYEGFNHVDAFLMNFDTLLTWTVERFAGEPALDTCPE